MATRTTRNRAVLRLTAVCAMTGAALLTAVTGGQAWADGAPAPAPATPTATPAVKAPAAAGDAGSGAAQPAPAPPTAIPSPFISAVPTISPVPKNATRPAAPLPSLTREAEGGAPAPAPASGQPQVREVPKGAAQAGDGSTAGDSSGLQLIGGGAVAAIGAGALGFAVLRRRSGARG
ncbi:sortase-dependent protein [Kitasatospora sp. NPDC059463]|uniref:sortase-dependent protein n=1 Tax=unclassified Kitasatospora TaxID=2633591 RepID=UPI0036C72BFD